MKKLYDAMLTKRDVVVYGQRTEFDAAAHFIEYDGEWNGFIVFKDERFSPLDIMVSSLWPAKPRLHAPCASASLSGGRIRRRGNESRYQIAEIGSGLRGETIIKSGMSR